MKGRWLAGVLLALACLGAGPGAMADERDCQVPLADWQPRDALLKKLEAEGWTAISIRTDDGCYKVKAIKADGARLKAKYDPATLTRIPDDRHDD